MDDVLCQAWICLICTIFFWIRIAEFLIIFCTKYRQSVCIVPFISDNNIGLHRYTLCVKTCLTYTYLSIRVGTSVVVETVSEASHLCWNNETIRFKSSLTSIIIESTYLTLNMSKSCGCFKVKVGWRNAFYGETGSRKGLGETLTIKKTFTLSVNKIIIYQFSMFKSLDSIVSVVEIFMYQTISQFKQVLRSRKGLDYNTGRQKLVRCERNTKEDLGTIEAESCTGPGTRQNRHLSQ